MVGSSSSIRTLNDDRNCRRTSFFALAWDRWMIFSSCLYKRSLSPWTLNIVCAFVRGHLKTTFSRCYATMMLPNILGNTSFVQTLACSFSPIVKSKSISFRTRSLVRIVLDNVMSAIDVFSSRNGMENCTEEHTFTTIGPSLF